MENIKEIWRDIEGYENLYQVSSDGRVKSLNYLRTGKKKILKSAKNNMGYLIVQLCKEGKRKNYTIHRLVAQSFLPNHNNLPQVNHKDENKTNNTIWINDDGSIDYNKSNLEWCDMSYNNNFGTRNERISKTNSKPILQFTKNNEFVRRWDSIIEVENELGFNHRNISSCCKGKIKSAYGYIWGYSDDYEKIKFNVFDLDIYEKKVT